MLFKTMRYFRFLFLFFKLLNCIIYTSILGQHNVSTQNRFLYVMIFRNYKMSISWLIKISILKSSVSLYHCHNSITIFRVI